MLSDVFAFPFCSHGWYANGRQLHALIHQLKIENVIEVGSWLGCSARHIASELPLGGVIYAVDHWKGSTENQAGEDAWIPEMDYLYEQFLSNVIHAGLTDKIVPVRMDSLDAAKALDHLFVDLYHLSEITFC